MPKYLMKWNAGYGQNYECHEADNHEEAEIIAEQLCREEAESNMSWEVEILTQENAEDYGFEDELEQSNDQ